MCRMKKVSLFLVDLKLEYVNHRLKKKKHCIAYPRPNKFKESKEINEKKSRVCLSFQVNMLSTCWSRENN